MLADTAYAARTRGDKAWWPRDGIQIPVSARNAAYCAGSVAAFGYSVARGLLKVKPGVFGNSAFEL